MIIPVGYAGAQVKILFDATKGEMAGNADWVIDADLHNVGVGTTGAYTSTSATKSNPQRIPTPAQSGITSSTSETYWNGGISAWAVDCAKRGYTVETLPWNGQITYGNSSNVQDLSNYKVFVVDEPNLKFSATEKTAILQFVQNGGSLFMIADHNISDRNGDGWDSPHIWDDLLSNNTVQTYPFGIYFDTVDFSQTTTNIGGAASDSIIHGPMGNVTKVQYSGGTTMTLNLSQNPTAKGVVFKTGSSTSGTTNVMFAYARYGHGKVAAMGDSSPADDGTGNPDCTLYNGYFADASGNHQLLIMNATIWLATSDTTVSHVSVADTRLGGNSIHIFPNPSHGIINLSTDVILTNASIEIYNFEGRIVAKRRVDEFLEGATQTFELPAGTYIAKVQSDKGLQSSVFAVY